MLKKIQSLIVAIALAAGIGTVAFAPATYAACSSASDCVQDGLDATGGSGSKASASDIIALVVKVLLFIIGAISVIMIIIGGLRYVVSQGDSGAITSAKNTILYAVVGLLVALFAYAIVNFVVERFI